MSLEWQCPRCYTRLDAADAGSVQVNPCGRCGGIWFDAGELAGLAQARPGMLAGLEHRFEPAEGPEGAPPAALGGPLCPACRVFMQEFEYPWAPGIRLDGCTRCRGIWVDDGELTRIEAYVERYRRAVRAPVEPGLTKGEARTGEGRMPTPGAVRTPVEPGTPGAGSPLGARVEAVQSLLSHPRPGPGAPG